VFDSGDGPAVLLLHGFPDSRHLWRYQIAPLIAHGFRVIAPDLRGFGDAPRPRHIRDYALPIVTADAIGMLDALKVRRAAVVGHDWGAALAWFAAGVHPERFDRIAALSVGVIGGNPGWRSPRQLARSWYFLFFQLPLLPEAAIRASGFRFFKRMLRGQGDIERYLVHYAKPGTITPAINWYRANVFPQVRTAFTARPSRYAMPAMGVWSDGDPFLGEPQMTASAQLVEGPWRYEKISGAGHWLMLDKPDEVSRLLIDFLATRY
jgi:pimeloyl-ACP methyl ester carboxylesterase